MLIRSRPRPVDAKRVDALESGSDSDSSVEDGSAAGTLMSTRCGCRHWLVLIALLIAWSVVCSLFTAITAAKLYEAGSELRFFWESPEGTRQEIKDTSVVMLDGQFPLNLGRCALVGGGDGMVGRKRGAEIDRLDTVIRVNRVPMKQHYEDFGRRTDVYFADAHHFHPDGKYEYMVIGDGGTHPCNYSRANDAKLRCPFSALVLKGSDSPEKGKLWAERFPEESPGWRPSGSKLPIGHQSEGVNVAAYLFAPLYHNYLLVWTRKRPTNGFHALLTFAPLCSSLRLYGYDGLGTADGHVIGRSHDLETEHLMLKQMVAGQLPGAEWQIGRNAPTGASLWLRGRFTALSTQGGLIIVRD